jgi:hypothetical protein
MHLITDTLARVNLPTKVTLAVGYALAVPPLLAIVPAFRNPAGRTRVLSIPHRVIIAAALLGAGCITAGWFATGVRARNAVNVGWVIVCTTIWLRAENKLRLQRVETESK